MKHRQLLTLVLIGLLALVVVPAAAQEQVIPPYFGPLVQEEAAPLSAKVTPYASNPVLKHDPALEWEAGGITFPDVIYANGQYHMFYIGYTKSRLSGSVNYATSPDGINWTKYAGNPVLWKDATLAPNGVMMFVMLLDGDTWKMYFSPWLRPSAWYERPQTYLLATAPAPTGPWTIGSEPVFTKGEAANWDGGPVWVNSVMRVDDQYVMYYEGTNQNYENHKIGLATSPDGINWTRYDDPATDSSGRRNSDPVFDANEDESAWDSGYVSNPTVRQRNGQWAMFYGGGKDESSRSAGFATSTDGIHWTRQGDVLLPTKTGGIFCHTALVEGNGADYLYYVDINYESAISYWDFNDIQMAVVEGLAEPAAVTAAQEDANRALFERYLNAAWNAEQPAQFVFLLTADHIHHDATLPEPVVGIKALIEYVKKCRSDLPNIRFEIDDLTTEGDRMVADLRALGEGVEVPVTASTRVVDGKLAEVWFDVNSLTSNPAFQEAAGSVEAENIALVYRYVDFFQNLADSVKDIETFNARYGSLFASSYVEYGLFMLSEQGSMYRPSGDISWFRTLNEAFPDLEFTAEAVMAAGDLVTLHYSARGTFTNRWFPTTGVALEPTGTQVVEQGVYIFRVRDDKFTEVWWYAESPLYSAETALALKQNKRINPIAKQIYKLSDK